MSDHPKIHFDLPTGVQATDLTQVFTSKPYPVLAIDAMTARGTVDSQRLMQSIDDAMAPSAGITSLEFRPALKTASVENDAMESAATITSLEMVDAAVTVIETTVESEAVDPAATIETMELRPALVENSIEDEAISTTATITSLELA